MAAADDLFEGMCRSKAGWKHSDLAELYKGFGFAMREGGKHTVFWHPKYPELRATVTRARDLPIGYVQEAIRLVRLLKGKEEGRDE